SFSYPSDVRRSTNCDTLQGVTVSATDRSPSVSWAVSSENQPDAFDVYRDSFVDFCDVRDVAHGGRTGFHSRTRAHMFGSTMVARARSSGQTLVRDASHIRRSGLDHINVTLNLAETLGDSDGRTV